jgi:hypothetical protein
MIDGRETRSEYPCGTDAEANDFRRDRAGTGTGSGKRWLRTAAWDEFGAASDARGCAAARFCGVGGGLALGIGEPVGGGESRGKHR